jgi:hypothetical protein
MNEEEINKAQEPSAPYNSKRISFFNSFEEMDESHYKWLATLTPEQHLMNATEHIKRIFAEKLSQNPGIGNRIYFD